MESKIDGSVAQEALAASERARAAMAARATTPVWAKLSLSLAIGTLMGAQLLHWWWVVGLAFASMVAIAIAEARVEGRHGRITDDRAIGATFVIFFAFNTVIMITFTLRTDTPSPLWVALAAAGVCALVAYGFFEASDHYQRRRLERGDFKAVDLS